ncbi:transposase [Mesorhizobium newzealandense]|uniref:Transposase n=1 Tax=Mesorhizobium newzealandense TaxID=1300302 RepID=A0ABW4UDB6_9HYPH
MQFKLQLCQDIRGGVIGRRDAQRTYEVSANLIQLSLTQFDRGELNDEEAEASVIAEYEARIAASSARSVNSRWNWTLPKNAAAGDRRRQREILHRHRPAPSDGVVK